MTLKTPNLYWQAILTLIIIQSYGYAGVSDYLAREATIKHIEDNNVATISQYSNLTYLIELIALGLVAAALLAVTLSIYTRFKSGKKEQKKILSLRRSAEHDKKIFDATVNEINSIGKQVEQHADEAQQQVNEITETVKEAEQHAETVSSIELEMKQLVDGTTERMNHIQDYWEQQLKETTGSMHQINENLEKGIEKTAAQSIQAGTLLENLASINRMYSDSNNMSGSNSLKQDGVLINTEIKETLDLTLKESKELLTQIKDYQQQAKAAFSSFTNTLSGFESQAHEQFDDIFNTADIARQELNANLDESREYMKIFRKKKSHEEKLILEGIDKEPAKNTPSPHVDEPAESTEEKTSVDEAITKLKTEGRKGRPFIGMNEAQDLTDPSLLKKYGEQSVKPADEDKNLVTLFSKFRHHGS